MPYDPELPCCFGEKDFIFANHPLDKDRAFVWLTKLRAQQASWNDASDQIEEYLRQHNSAVFHILDQVERAKPLLAPWLNGPVDHE